MIIKSSPLSLSLFLWFDTQISLIAKQVCTLSLSFLHLGEKMWSKIIGSQLKSGKIWHVVDKLFNNI